jgi:hypothetical protein
MENVLKLRAIGGIKKKSPKDRQRIWAERTPFSRRLRGFTQKSLELFSLQ